MRSGVLIFLAFLPSILAVTKNKCVPRNYGYDSNVCVCSGSYCDTIAPVEPINEGTAVIFTSSKAGQRFERTTSNWIAASPQQVSDSNLTFDSSQQFQKIIGFGGAFTDAAGINLVSLPQLAQDYLIAAYYGDGGIGYNIGRIPMASCDFSTHNYSYDDVVNDFDLEHFSLTDEDIKYKIPYIKQAIYQSKAPIKLFGSPWSAPFWLKTNQMMQGNGTLIGAPGNQYYKTWANYFIKFLDEYAKQGVDIWAVTAQNEPTTGYIYDYSWQTMGFTPELQRDFIKTDLGPALENSAYKTVSLMILDDQRFMLPKWAQVVLSDPDAAKYVSHIAVHWYGDKYTPIEVLNQTHEQFPNYSLFGTEACSGEISFLGHPVQLGDWRRGESYAEDILETLNNWYTGWTDWNLALDLQGGPNWVGNFVDSPIIVNSSSGEFYKQPMFYAMGHFSSFLPLDSVRVGLVSNMNKNFLNRRNILTTGFVNANGYKVVIVLNKYNRPIDVVIAEKSGTVILPVNVPARSFQTILWK